MRAGSGVVAGVRAAAGALALAGLLLAPGGCAQVSLAWASFDVTGPAATPPVLGAFEGAPPVESVAQWEESRAPALREAFQRHIYGYYPDASETRVLEHRVLDGAAFGGAGVLEEYSLQVSATFDDEAADSDVFRLDLLLPADAAGPVPVVLIQTFCPLPEETTRPAVSSGGPGVSCNGGIGSQLMKLVFRRYVRTPPIREFLARGYAIAAIYPSEVVPDRRRAGLDALDALAPPRAESDTRWGAIAAWGWVYSRILDVLENDPRIDQHGLIAFGHSRYGKAALVAAAFDPRVDAVIANQSGTGGAALNRDKKGETVRQITKSFPHWFATAYDNYAGREEELPVDQHQLLALIAPRPIFLGNARRDVWSDPNGTFRAAAGADPVYELYGVKGLDQAGMKDFNASADIAYWLRNDTHGILDRDWPAILDFLDAHFKSAGS